MRVERRASWVVVHLPAEVDVAVAPALREALLTAEHERGDLLIDLTGVTFLDAVGIGLLVGAQRRLAARSARVAITRPAPPVDRLLHVAGVRQLFDEAPLP